MDGRATKRHMNEMVMSPVIHGLAFGEYYKIILSPSLRTLHYRSSKSTWLQYLMVTFTTNDLRIRCPTFQKWEYSPQFMCVHV